MEPSRVALCSVVVSLVTQARNPAILVVSYLGLAQVPT
jgi:hypothetical protein